MKKILIAFGLLGVVVAVAQAATLLEQYQPGPRLINGTQLNKMVDTVNRLQGTGATPVLTSCGTTPAIAGSPTAGVVTMGTGSPTGCIITFPTSYYTAVPYCTVTWQTNIASMAYTVTATAVTLVQTGTSSNLVNYNCVAR